MNKKFKYSVTLLIDFSDSLAGWIYWTKISDWCKINISEFNKKYTWGFDSSNTFAFRSLTSVVYGFTSRKKMEEFKKMWYKPIYRNNVTINLDEYKSREKWCKKHFGNMNRSIHSRDARWNVYPKPDKRYPYLQYSIEFRFRKKEDYLLYCLTWVGNENSNT